MANRTELVLERLPHRTVPAGGRRAAATADIAEDLLLLGALEDKVVFTSMNRGGLQGCVVRDGCRPQYRRRRAGDDRVGFRGREDAARLDMRDPSTVATLQQCGQAVTELNRARLIAMVEPFMSSRAGDKVVNHLSRTR